MVRRSDGIKIKRVVWDDAMAKRAAHEGILDGIEASAIVITAASSQIIPYLTGRLEASGGFDISDDLETGTIFYDTPYAARMHQHPEYDFRGGKRGKFLKSTMSGSRRKVLDMFGNGLKARFSKGRYIPGRFNA